jgi:SAM-dependent methyltransferase
VDKLAEVPAQEASRNATLVERSLLNDLLNQCDLTRTLELGSGAGRLTDLFAARSRTSVALDLDRSRLIALGSRFSLGKDLPARVRADVRRLPFANASFTTTLLVRLLHRFEDPVPVFLEANRTLRPGGRLIVSVVPRPSWRTLGMDLSASLGGSPHDPPLTFSGGSVTPVSGYATPGYLMAEARLRSILERCGLTPINRQSAGWEDLPLLRRMPPRLQLRLPYALSRFPFAPTYFLVAQARGESSNQGDSGA